MDSEIKTNVPAKNRTVMLGGKASNSIQQYTRRAAVVLVVVEDALPGFRDGAPGTSDQTTRQMLPPVWMGVAPRETEIFGERFD